jgi:hypothetical protein
MSSSSSNVVIKVLQLADPLRTRYYCQNFQPRNACGENQIIL